jgi:hypothetical protein
MPLGSASLGSAHFKQNLCLRMANCEFSVKNHAYSSSRLAERLVLSEFDFPELLFSALRAGCLAQFSCLPTLASTACTDRTRMICVP